MGIEINPQFMNDFQTKLVEVGVNAWLTALEDSWWERMAIRQTQDTLTLQYQFMLSAAEIRPTNSKGTELEFEDLVAQAYALTADNFGTGLRLYRNEIEDMTTGNRPAAWSAGAMSAAAYWPQRQVADLILNGKTRNGYDGKPFFDPNHPVNPFDDTRGTYANLFTAKPLNPANLAAGIAAMMSIPNPAGAPRRLKPTMLVVDPSNQYNALTVTQAQVIATPTGNATTTFVAASNLIQSNYGLGQPLVIPELGDEPGVWYLGVPAREDLFAAPFIYSERKPFELNSYAPMVQAELDRLNEFEWHLRGRNTTAYGDPYLFFRFEPT
jgi:phage major head subunit gpT-like protein